MDNGNLVSYRRLRGGEEKSWEKVRSGAVVEQVEKKKAEMMERHIYLGTNATKPDFAKRSL